MVSLPATKEWAEFRYLREQLDLSGSALSKQLSLLEQARCTEVRKYFVGKRSRTSVRLSRAARHAFSAHVAALQEIVKRSGVESLQP
ncbi:transcriptional regulator [Streptomyces sp. cmx-4-25]|uniref:transcriptional regulator n=1 Tax=unclassified Streptomyces TaxID=2593676 RepID=UPI0039808067